MFFIISKSEGKGLTEDNIVDAWHWQKVSKWFITYKCILHICHPTATGTTYTYVTIHTEIYLPTQ